jgi:hypothetical protein
MKAKIIKSNSPIYWYAHYIGKVFDIYTTTSDFGFEKIDMKVCYAVKEKEYNCKRLIDLDDCEIIKENS